MAEVVYFLKVFLRFNQTFLSVMEVYIFLTDVIGNEVIVHSFELGHTDKEIRACSSAFSAIFQKLVRLGKRTELSFLSNELILRII